LRERVAAGQLDLALAWDNTTGTADGERIADLPLCWLGARDNMPVAGWNSTEPLPLIALEAPCMLRTIACDHLDRMGIAWRIAFVSPSLGGLWAATAAGLGIALRTPIGRPDNVQVIEPRLAGLPAMPTLGLALYRSEKSANPLGDHLTSIMQQALGETLSDDWLVSGRGAHVGIGA
jgi:DNA-binding transcriptional LysR family regulator